VKTEEDGMMEFLDVSSAPKILDELDRIKSVRENMFDRDKEDRDDMKKLRETFDAEFLKAVGCRGEFVDKIDALRTDMRKKHAEEEARFHETYGAILDGRDRFFDAYVERVRSTEAQLKDMTEGGRKTLEDVKARLNLPVDTLLLLEKSFRNDLRDKEKALEDGRNVVRNLFVRQLEGVGGREETQRTAAILEIARKARIQGDDGQPLACDVEAKQKEVYPMMETDLNAFYKLPQPPNGNVVAPNHESKYCPIYSEER